MVDVSSECERELSAPCSEMISPLTCDASTTAVEEVLACGVSASSVEAGMSSSDEVDVSSGSSSSWQEQETWCKGPGMVKHRLDTRWPDDRVVR
jgi:hypothetical protein